MDHLFAVQHGWLIPVLPLIAAAIVGFFGARGLRGRSHWPIWLGVGASAVLSFSFLFHGIGLSRGAEPGGRLYASQILYTWFQAGDLSAAGVKNFLHVDVGYYFDSLTAVMLAVVTGIGLLITIFSAGYMKGEAGYWRFFAYLGLFIFMMTNLVMGENLIMLYLGWEGVGLCSYLLIGYYYDRPAAREAAKKAFIVNRIGDVGFMLGILTCILAFGTTSFFGAGCDGLLPIISHPENFSPLQQSAAHWIPFLLMLGAFGKSAQFPLYVWLPDAMEGPTPVSALIHAATMVTAGVYMIVRCGPLFTHTPAAMWTIAAVGGFTAIFAACIALRQFDLKKIFAYSTISQLGFMFVAVGVMAPVAGVFHLMTHAFFKALLFLGSGVVMHAMAGELDLRKMSGLRRKLPQTFVVMGVGCLALAGFPGLSGFFSKDDIVAAAFHASTLLGIVLLATAFLTAYYTFRLFFRVFLGPLAVPAAPAPTHGHGGNADSHAAGAASESARATGQVMQSGVDVAAARDTPGHGHGDYHAHSLEPFLMLAPLWLLAIGALLAGYLNWPGEALGRFLGMSRSFQLALTGAGGGGVQPMGEQPAVSGLMVLSGIVSIAGIALAYVFHAANRAAGDSLANGLSPIATLFEHKFYVDELYDALIVRPLQGIGVAFYFFDRFVIDFFVWLISFVPQLSGWALKLTVQRGYLQGYAAAMLFGMAAILIIVFLR